MWQFHLDGIAVQCCSFSMDLEVRANFWNPFAAGPLQPRVSATGQQRILFHNIRLILLISLAICCIVSISSCSANATLNRGESLPRAFRMPPIDALPSTKLTSQSIIGNQLSKICVPFMTTFTLFRSPWTTLRVCATVILPSSCVRRSSLRNTASISLSPNSFFANFSIPCQAIVHLRWRPTY